MAELVFHTGPMDCGKSTLALQLDYTQSTHGRKGRVFTSQDRAGAGLITSRLGLSVQAIEVDEGFDFWRYVIGELTTGKRVDYIVCDEAQFYTRDHIDQLARVVDELQPAPVFDRVEAAQHPLEIARGQHPGHTGAEQVRLAGLDP